MEIKEGKPLKFKIVPKNAEGRELPLPGDLTVQYNGFYVSPDPVDLVYTVTEAGQVTAAGGGAQSVEMVTLVEDNVVASFEFVPV